jgi:hypothetical protein
MADIRTSPRKGNAKKQLAKQARQARAQAQKVAIDNAVRLALLQPPVAPLDPIVAEEYKAEENNLLENNIDLAMTDLTCPVDDFGKAIAERTFEVKDGRPLTITWQEFGTFPINNPEKVWKKKLLAKTTAIKIRAQRTAVLAAANKIKEGVEKAEKAELKLIAKKRKKGQAVAASIEDVRAVPVPVVITNSLLSLSNELLLRTMSTYLASTCFR